MKVERSKEILPGIKPALRPMGLCLALAAIIATIPAVRYWAQADAGAVTEPKVIHAEMPVYPELGHSLLAAGAVKVKVEIAKNGQVNAATIVSGHPVLRAATLRAAQKWLFEPTDETTLRQAELVFEFTPQHESGCQAQAVTPYHFKIPVPLRADVRETVSYVPTDAEGKRCKVHGILLKREKVEIIYGLLGYKPGYLRAEQRYFPNANSWVGGGCEIITIINPCTGKSINTQPQHAEVLYCPCCRRVEAKWHASRRVLSKAVPRQR